MVLAGESRAEATEAVGRLVNQVLRPSGSADWFEDQSLAELAIAECIEYAALRREVASRDAQYAWVRYWALQTRTPPSPWPMPGEPPAETTEDAVSLVNDLGEAERAWRAAWLRWVATKR